MIEEPAAIMENHEIAHDIYRMTIRTGIGILAKPGQFIQVQIPGFFLRRPFSIAEIEEKSITFIYKTVGSGTETLSQKKPGEQLNVLGPLGNPFPVLNEDVLLIGGGVGLPPLYETARQYRQNHRQVYVAAGFQNKKDVFYESEFAQLGCRIVIATMDGSYKTKGTVLDAIRQNQLPSLTVLACGPIPMLKAVTEVCHKGYISLESRMACGLGVCNGCVMKDQNGEAVRVCKDGPVFPIGKVVL